MSLADEIRAFAYRTAIAPSVEKGDALITVRAGDIHSAMKLQGRMPAVCSALDARVMQKTFGLELIARSGPAQGANVYFQFAASKNASLRSETQSAKPTAAAEPQPTKHSKGLIVAPVTPGARTGGKREVYLVACVKTKRNSSAMACDLYTSDWFRSARRFVEARDGTWFILSAKYGLLEPSTVVDPYEQTLKHMPAPERRRWAQEVAAAFRALRPPPERIVMLAGLDYAGALLPYLSASGAAVERPMAALTFGQQLSWLKRNP